MDDYEVEKRLKKAMSDITPDVFSKIEQKIKKEDKNMVKSKFGFMKYAVAACLVMCLGVGGYTYYSDNYKLDSIVDIDVNPSIEILVNKNSKVIKANALNADAEKVLAGMDLKNIDIKIATNAIVGSIVKNGYMASEDAGVLITVVNDDAEKANELKEKIAEDVKETLQENNVDASIIKQVVVQNEELKNLAKENNVSVGKAALIRDLKESGKELDEKEASKKPVKDLVKIVLADAKVENAEKVEMELDDEKYEIKFTKDNKKFEYELNKETGEILSKEVEEKENKRAPESIKITAEEAKDIALKDSGEEKVKDLEVELDAGKYEVEFTGKDGREYSYEIGAANGNILSKKIDDEKVKKNTNKEVKKITEEEAKNIALKDSGEKNIKELEVELDGGKYEVEFTGEDGREYSYEIGVANGKILSKEVEEKEEEDEEKEDIEENVKLLTEEEVKKIVLNDAKVKDAKEFEIELEDGKYKVEFSDEDGTEFSYEIDAVSGKILDKEIEEADEKETITTVKEEKEKVMKEEKKQEKDEEQKEKKEKKVENKEKTEDEEAEDEEDMEDEEDED